jgi:hypothetical protein
MYPADFYQRNAQEMEFVYCDLRDEMKSAPREFHRRILRDLLISVPKENLAMFSSRGIRRVVVLQAALMLAILTVVALMCYTVSQQVLRQGANYPQVQMAQDAAARLGADPSADVTGAKERVDLAQSLAPFLIVYDANGKAVASSGVLDGETPTPRPGTFTFAASHGENRVTWAPRRGVRVAAVLVPIKGGAGYVLAGRSLAEVETSEMNILHLVEFAWIVLVAMLLIGTAFVMWCVPADPPRAMAV